MADVNYEVVANSYASKYNPHSLKALIKQKQSLAPQQPKPLAKKQDNSSPKKQPPREEPKLAKQPSKQAEEPIKSQPSIIQPFNPLMQQKEKTPLISEPQIQPKRRFSFSDQLSVLSEKMRGNQSASRNSVNLKEQVCSDNTKFMQNLAHHLVQNVQTIEINTQFIQQVLTLLDDLSFPQTISFALVIKLLTGQYAKFQFLFYGLVSAIQENLNTWITNTSLFLQNARKNINCLHFLFLLLDLNPAIFLKESVLKQKVHYSPEQLKQDHSLLFTLLERYSGKLYNQDRTEIALPFLTGVWNAFSYIYDPEFASQLPNSTKTRRLVQALFEKFQIKIDKLRQCSPFGSNAELSELYFGQSDGLVVQWEKQRGVIGGQSDSELRYFAKVYEKPQVSGSNLVGYLRELYGKLDFKGAILNEQVRAEYLRFMIPYKIERNQAVAEEFVQKIFTEVFVGYAEFIKDKAKKVELLGVFIQDTLNYIITEQKTIPRRQERTDKVVFALAVNLKLLKINHPLGQLFYYSFLAVLYNKLECLFDASAACKDPREMGEFSQIFQSVYLEGKPLPPSLPPFNNQKLWYVSIVRKFSLVFWMMLHVDPTAVLTDEILRHQNENRHARVSNYSPESQEQDQAVFHAFVRVFLQVTASKPSFLAIPALSSLWDTLSYALYVPSPRNHKALTLLRLVCEKSKPALDDLKRKDGTLALSNNQSKPTHKSIEDFQRAFPDVFKSVIEMVHLETYEKEKVNLKGMLQIYETKAKLALGHIDPTSETGKDFNFYQRLFEPDQTLEYYK